MLGKLRIRTSGWDLVITLPLLVLAGCATRYVNGDQVTYRFNLMAVVGVGVAGALAMPLGWFLRRFSQRIGWVLMVVGALALVLVAPSMWHDRVEVDDEHFACSVGALGGSHHSIRFANLQSIRWVEEESQGRARHTNYFLDCVKKDRTVERVPVGDLMKEAVGEILAQARAHGVPIEGLPRS
jgi:hypothetical protein